MKTTSKTVAAGVVVLVSTGIASAAVLAEYGVVSGAADVQPSLEIAEVYTGNDTVYVQNNMDREFHSGSNTAELNINSTTTAVDADIPAQSTEPFPLSTDVETGQGGLTIDLELNGNVIDQTDTTYSTQEVQQ